MIVALHRLTFVHARAPHEVECERCGRAWTTIAAWAREKASACPGDVKLAGVVAALEGPEHLGRDRRRELAEAIKGLLATGLCALVVCTMLALLAGCGARVHLGSRAVAPCEPRRAPAAMVAELP